MGWFLRWPQIQLNLLPHIVKLEKILVPFRIEQDALNARHLIYNKVWSWMHWLPPSPRFQKDWIAVCQMFNIVSIYVSRILLLWWKWTEMTIGSIALFKVHRIADERGKAV